MAYVPSAVADHDLHRHRGGDIDAALDSADHRAGLRNISYGDICLARVSYGGGRVAFD